MRITYPERLKHEKVIMLISPTVSNNSPNIASASIPEIKVFSGVVASQALLSTALRKGRTSDKSTDPDRQRVTVELHDSKAWQKCRTKLRINQSYSSRVRTEWSHKHRRASPSDVSLEMHRFYRGLEFLILALVCDRLPSQILSLEEIILPTNVTLSDPDFNKPGIINALLGVEIFYDLLCRGHITLERGDGHTIKTKLGWINAGKFEGPSGKTTNMYVSKRRSK